MRGCGDAGMQGCGDEGIRRYKLLGYGNAFVMGQVVESILVIFDCNTDCNDPSVVVPNWLKLNSGKFEILFSNYFDDWQGSLLQVVEANYVSACIDFKVILYKYLDSIHLSIHWCYKPK